MGNNTTHRIVTAGDTEYERMKKVSDLLQETLILNEVSITVGVSCLLSVALTKIRQKNTLSKKEFIQMISDHWDGFDEQ